MSAFKKKTTRDEVASSDFNHIRDGVFPQHYNKTNTGSNLISYCGAITAFVNVYAYWYESAKPWQYYCSCLPVSILLPMKKLLFWKKMSCSGNTILCRLAKCCDASIFALAAKFHLELHDVVRSSITCIKDNTRSSLIRYSSSFYLPNNTTVCTFTRIRF